MRRFAILSILFTIVHCANERSLAEDKVSSSSTTETPIRDIPLIECASDAIHLDFYTAIPFEGIIYVYGRKTESKSCIGIHTWINQVNVLIPHTGCGVVKRRFPTNTSEVIVSVQVMLSFHPNGVLTTLDRLLTIECIHDASSLAADSDEQLMNLSATENVSFVTRLPPLDGEVVGDTIATTTATTTRPTTVTPTEATTTSSPTSTVLADLRNTRSPIEDEELSYDCSYELHTDGNSNAVTLGDRLLHSWHCKVDSATSLHLCLQITSCTMHSQSAVNQLDMNLRLIDSYSCVRDRSLMPNYVKHDDNTLTASVVHEVFALEDDSRVWFECKIMVIENDSTKSCAERQDDISELCSTTKSREILMKHSHSSLSYPTIEVKSRTLIIPPTISEAATIHKPGPSIPLDINLPTVTRRRQSEDEEGKICMDDWAFYGMIAMFTLASLLVPFALLMWCIVKRRSSKSFTTKSLSSATPTDSSHLIYSTHSAYKHQPTPPRHTNRHESSTNLHNSHTNLHRHAVNADRGSGRTQMVSRSRITHKITTPKIVPAQSHTTPSYYVDESVLNYVSKDHVVVTERNGRSHGEMYGRENGRRY